MTSLDIPLSQELQSFVEEQVGEGHYASSSEYVRHLIRREQDRLMFRARLLEAGKSPLVGYADEEFFKALADEVLGPELAIAAPEH